MPFLSCNHLNLYYEQTGHGPHLLLLPGLGCDTRMWEPLVPYLCERFTVVALDLRGTGKSEKPTIPYTLDELTSDVASFLETMGKGAMHVLGFSLGGLVAMNLAIRRPDQVRNLILASTLPCWNAPFPPPASIQALFREKEITTSLLTEVYETIFGSAYKQRISAEAYINFRLQDPNPQPLENYLQQLHALEIADVRAQVSRISAPTLIVTGNEDRVVPPKNARWLHEQIRASDLMIVEQTGHMLPVEQPQWLTQVIQAAIANAQ